ncbi:MAG: SMI1/KNR4 family protein [Lachnospiraceae bacterium]|nr:SMI1/KNR4 family protein [Lachnospiraceae bacterium]
MYDKELFQRVIKYCGITKCDPATDERIKEAQEQLELLFPIDYVSFIKEYGEGGIPGTCIFGMHGDYYTVVNRTKGFREQFNIPKEYIAVTKGSEKNKSWIICLDTSRMKDGICPAVWFDRKTFEITEYAESFDEVVDKEMMRLYLSRIKPYENEEQEKRFIPDGMGYKSVWMLIKGSDQKTIADKLLNGDVTFKEYRAGLEEIKKSDNRALVTADYEGKNYVIMPLTQEYFQQEWIERNCTDFPECYVFLTERVTETHGFLKAVNGKIVRYYYRDDDGIVDIGRPIIEEQMNEINLPHDMKEYREALKSKTKTIIDEDVIMEIALDAGSVEEYPYADVIIGELVK